MKQAEIREEEKERVEEQTKLKDLSEWKSATADALKQKLQAKMRAKPSQVGYQTLHLISNSEVPVVGRRTFGELKKEPVNQLEVKEDDDEHGLDSLWKKDKGVKSSKSKRPLTDNSPSNSKKRKSEP